MDNNLIVIKLITINLLTIQLINVYINYLINNISMYEFFNE